MNISSSSDTIVHDTLTFKDSTVVSLFEGHGFTGVDGPQPLNDPGTDWVFILTTALLFIFALIRFYNGRRITFLLGGIFSKNQANQILREANVFNHQTFLPLFLLNIGAVAIYSYVFTRDHIQPFILEFSPPAIIGLIFVGYLLFFLLKIFTLNISGWIFNNGETTFEYIHNIFLFNILITLVLIPSIYFISYLDSPYLKWITLGIVISLFIYRFIRGIGIGLSDTKFSVFHLFLYLCTLEILPLLVLAKLLKRYIFIV
jgi:hypothetical protein